MDHPIHKLIPEIVAWVAKPKVTPDKESDMVKVIPDDCTETIAAFSVGIHRIRIGWDDSIVCRDSNRISHFIGVTNPGHSWDRDKKGSYRGWDGIELSADFVAALKKLALPIIGNVDEHLCKTTIVKK